LARQVSANKINKKEKVQQNDHKKPSSDHGMIAMFFAVQLQDMLYIFSIQIKLSGQFY
jgi:hypothetical protein